MTLATIFPSLDVVSGLSRIQILRLALDAATETHINAVRDLVDAGPKHKDYIALDLALFVAGAETWVAMKAYHAEKLIEGNGT